MGIMHNFVTVDEVMAVLNEIKGTSDDVQEGLAQATADSVETQKNWAEQKKLEQPPNVSTCEAALDYLNKQNSVQLFKRWSKGLFQAKCC